MDYLTIEQVKKESGLRLVLTRDVPGPWSEAAKAALRWHEIGYKAADIYWACFSNMLEALPHEVNPMPDSLRQGWSALKKSISGYDPILIEQRNAIFEKHLWLPLEF